MSSETRGPIVLGLTREGGDRNDRVFDLTGCIWLPCKENHRGRRHREARGGRLVKQDQRDMRVGWARGWQRRWQEAVCFGTDFKGELTRFAGGWKLQGGRERRLKDDSLVRLGHRVDRVATSSDGEVYGRGKGDGSRTRSSVLGTWRHTHTEYTLDVKQAV